MSSSVLPQLTVLLQLPASSLYSRPYSRAFYGHFMDLSAMSRRHLDTSLYSIHSWKPVDQLRTCRSSCL